MGTADLTAIGTPPAHGSLSRRAAEVTYTPASNYNGGRTASPSRSTMGTVTKRSGDGFDHGDGGQRIRRSRTRNR